jgi:hypothetical protein
MSESPEPAKVLDLPGAEPQKRKPGFKGLCAALVESAVAFAKLTFCKPLAKWFKDEAQGVTRGWLLFTAATLLLLSVSVWQTHSFDTRRSDRRMASSNQAFTISNAFLMGERNAKDDENRKLKESHKIETDKSNAENLSLKMDVGRLSSELAPWKALAASIYTNELPHKRMDLLLDQVSSITNELRLLGPGALRFDLYANSVPLTNGTIIEILTNRELVIEARNVGEISAESLTINLSLSAIQTNVVAAGWEIHGHRNFFDNGGAKKLFVLPTWSVVSQYVVGSGGYFRAPPMVFSTNSASSPVAGTVEVHSNRSRNFSVSVFLSFKPL